MMIDEIRKRDEQDMSLDPDVDPIKHAGFWGPRDRHHLLRMVDELSVMCAHLGDGERDSYIRAADLVAGYFETDEVTK